MKSGPLLIVLLLAWPGPVMAGDQAGPDQEAVWNAFVSWFRTVPEEMQPINAYLAELKKQGTAQPELDRQAAIISRLFAERPEAVEIYYDRLAPGPEPVNPVRSGEPPPSPFLVQAAGGLTPGAALDAGLGQGGNAIFLARHGWLVTAFDLSAESLKTARSHAEEAGIHFAAVRAGYREFDYGTDRWDLIVLDQPEPPLADPDFVRRLHRSLRKGGIVIFEQFVPAFSLKSARADSPLPPRKLRACLSPFKLDRFEETYWPERDGTPGSLLVQVVARKI